MNCKKLLPCLLFLGFFYSCKNSNSGRKQQAIPSAYRFDTPKGWVSEKIAFPIEFAPQIPYKGFEELRFAPGWEFTTSADHWSYTFLWWLEGNIELDPAILKEHLEHYYLGLLSRNIRERHIATKNIMRPAAEIRNTTIVNGDTETYRGTIKMPDYLDITIPTLTLNCVIHKRSCKDHTGILFEISPQAIGHPIWQQLNQLVAGFECQK